MNDDNDTPVPIELVSECTLKLDTNITTQDICDVLVNETEENLLLERDKVEHEATTARQEHAKLEEQLKDQTRKLIKGQKADTKAKALVKALDEFTGSKTHAAEIDPDDTTISVAKKKVTYTVNIWGKSKAKRATYDSAEVDREFTVAFSDEMGKTVASISKAALKVKEHDDKLTQIRKLLADMPRLARRAKAAITKAHLMGHLKTTADVLRIVQAVEPRALPQLT